MKIRFIVEIDDPNNESGWNEEEWEEGLVQALDYLAGRTPFRKELSPISFNVTKAEEGEK